MIKYPIEFYGSSRSPEGLKTNWRTEASKNETTCCVPVEFEGISGHFSPEDFFLLSLQNCFVATFKVFASYSGLSFDGLEVNGRLKVDKDPAGKPWMSSVHLDVNILKASDQKRAHLIVKKTLENGFILKSVKSDISYEVVFK